MGGIYSKNKFQGRAMPDESCNTYSSVITDMFNGHNFIEENFSKSFLPKVKLIDKKKVYVGNRSIWCK